MKLNDLVLAEERSRGITRPGELQTGTLGGSGGCGGCGDKKQNGIVISRRIMAFERLFAIGSGFKELVKTAVGPKVSEAIFDERKAKCVECQDVDSKGERLFRKFCETPEVFTCGPSPVKDQIPVDRKPEVDGCGCFLNVKWIGERNKCPRGKW